ncbi:2-oxo acid dehydrogenase subunit E2 [Rhizobium sp. ARZ01]|uniref:dihydrolipoamide acetyltransferase family protein n=1 Tax=Rhizobium sp. ARZ01 TaxID=2769313 RepID=UPI00177A8403|nr:dihydrolipoamide acetyltransferase family protein [Rhizobium sp. ARZ01]MBD9375709.1 2-oxo acid dehydrogenase subunit E2 [Rhizobium sp. ARZ01]
MAIEIVMPALSPSMVSGKLVCWHVAVGDKVRKGDLLAELETDKAALDIEAPEDGVLERILIEGGTADVPVETIIAVLGDGKVVAQPAAAPPPPEPSAPIAQLAVASDEPPFRSSPLARRLGRELDVRVENLSGTGPKGRVLAQDVREAAERTRQALQRSPSDVVPSTPLPAVTAVQAQLPAGARLVPHGAMRRTIARRLVEAKQTVPHFYLEAHCEVDALSALRSELNAAQAAADSETRFTVNDLLTKAWALAISRVPAAMVTYCDEGLIHHTSVDIGVAVALDDGLITPILRDAARLSPGALATSARDAIERARAGRLSPEEYTGGLAGISNLGMFGVSSFAAIINPPQSMNLAVGAVETELALRDGVPKEIKRMRLTLSVDHRAIDGATAAKVLQELKRLIETPLLLMA